jgi:hypothetical protein
MNLRIEDVATGIALLLFPLILRRTLGKELGQGWEGRIFMCAGTLSAASLGTALGWAGPAWTISSRSINGWLRRARRA